MENVVLVGFSGTGKTQVGRLAAGLLGWSFIDVDDEIVKRAGKSIPRVFSEDGEPAFRTLEARVIAEVMNGDRQVVATGGGAFSDAKSRALMLARALVICLEAQPETIWHRLEGQQAAEGTNRPLLSAPDPLQRIRALKAERRAAYAQAHWTIHTDLLPVTHVAQEIVHAARLLLPRLAPPAEDSNVAATVVHSGGSYPVVVGWGVLDRAGSYFEQAGVKGPVYIIGDDTVMLMHSRRLKLSLLAAGIAAHSLAFPPGEKSKDLDVARGIYGWLADRRAERGQTIVAFGGGVGGDLAGFVAATYVRGMGFIQVPTSLAAMVDASTGGKVAVNLPQAKNLVGAFYQPRLVLADVALLRTLGARGLAEGWAEAIKHGLILDPALFETFERNVKEIETLQPEITAQVVRRSVAIKAQVVSEDERETTGRRALLNYGHTVGHALEAVTEYGKFLHGEAVAVGMMAAAHISRAMGLLDDAAVERQRRVLEAYHLPLRAPGVSPDAVLEATTRDKKTSGGSIRWVLLEGVGRAVLRGDVPARVVREAVESVTGEPR